MVGSKNEGDNGVAQGMAPRGGEVVVVVAAAAAAKEHQVYSSQSTRRRWMCAGCPENGYGAERRSGHSSPPRRLRGGA
jgi:TPP-dependent indolepyruvate ferredoxin oxidoreductase alpha subunit